MRASPTRLPRCVGGWADLKLGFLLTRPGVGKISRAHACPVWGTRCSTPSSRLPRETLAFREELDALKFLCRDLWAAMFHKHMDSLRTNHQVRVRARPGPAPGEGPWELRQRPLGT